MPETRSKPFVFASVALAALLLLTVSVSAQVERKTWALVIGVSKYPRLPGGQQLQFADRDAEDFASDLKRYGISATNVRLLTAQEATVAAIKSAIGNWLARSSTENDDVVIFFSGHGLFERQYNESYLLAYDSDANDPYATAISVSDLANALTRRVRARRIVILADAVRRDLFPPDEDGPAAATSFAQSFGALASARPGLSILLASGPGEFSREGARWAGHGVFTRFLLDAMAGNADADGNGSITVEEIYNFVSKGVAEDTSNKQHVWRAQSQSSEIVLARSQSIARAPASQTTTPAAVAPRNKPQEPVKQPTDSTAAQPQQSTKPQQPTGTQKQPETIAATPKSEPSKPATSEPRPVQPPPSNRQPETIARNKPAETTSKKPEATPKPESPTARKTETENKPPAEKRPTDTVTAPRPNPVTPPAGKPVNTKPPESTGAVPDASAGVKTEASPPPKPALQPPRVSVNASAPRNQPEPTPSSVPVAPTVAAPSPLTLQLELAIAEGALIEPRGNSAWDIYQRLGGESGAASEVARLKIRLADALEKAGREIVSGDVRADNIADKVDEFKRAGQMLSRARTLRPENTAIGILEKVSAVQALVALQFYDEAERSLASLQDAKVASVENVLGLVHQGKLDNYRAERAFKRAIEIDPAWAAPHYNLALIYRNQKNDAVIDELAAAAQLAPMNAEMSTALGDEYFNREQWQKAVEAYRKAIAISPADDSLHTKLGNALYSLGLKDEANLEYKKANELRRKQ